MSEHREGALHCFNSPNSCPVACGRECRCHRRRVSSAQGETEQLNPLAATSLSANRGLRVRAPLHLEKPYPWALNARSNPSRMPTGAADVSRTFAAPRATRRSKDEFLPAGRYCLSRGS
jgi:hypothetical protein